MRPRWVIGGKAGGERKQGRKRKVKIVRKTVNGGEQGNKG